jgi:hypothetical protein
MRLLAEIPATGGIHMRRLLALGALIALVAPMPATAAPDAPVRVLRSLVYDVSYAAHTRHDKKTSGFNGGYGGDPNGGGPGVGGSGTASVAMDGSDSGRLTIDIIAATPDGGLVVDVAYAGKLNNAPKMRVALYQDGRLSADPTKTLGPEALHILPLLARGFMANRTVEVGASWTVQAPPPAKGATTYRVSSLDGTNATIALDGSLSVGGVNGFDESDHGTTTYATDLISPLSYDLNSRIRRQLASDETITTDAHLVAKLVSDSFVKK